MRTWQCPKIWETIFSRKNFKEKGKILWVFFATVRQIRKVVSIVLVSGTSRIINIPQWQILVRFPASHSADSRVCSTGVKSHETATKLLSLLLLEERFIGTKKKFLPAILQTYRIKLLCFRAFLTPH